MKHPQTRQAGGAHHPRRSAHVRHGIAVPPVRHLCQPGTALQAARRRDVPVLQGIQGRPDSGRGHHRSRLHGLLHGRRHRLRELRRGDDSVLHLLLDVRLPARGRPDLGLRRRARQRLPVRRHGRPHHAGRRRLAAPGRPQPRARQHRAHLRHLRSGLRLRNRHHRAGRHPPHVPGAGRPLLLPHALQRELPHAADAGGPRSGGHAQGHLPLPARPRTARPWCSCSAAARF